MIVFKKFMKWMGYAVLLLLLGLVLSICLLNLVNPTLPSIRCGGTSVIDPSISHKYKGDTINAWKLFIVILIVPLFQIIFAEWLLTGQSKNPYAVKETSSGCLKKCLGLALTWYRNYFFGMAFLLLLNDIAKTTVNAPRPHWIDSCKPNFTKEECNLGWVDNYECTNTEISRWRLADARKSFPSGHAALGFYSAVFMMIYQHNRTNARKFGNLFVLWIHSLWLGWGIFCALSRVADNRHHLLDVSVGAFLGTSGAIFAAFYLCNCFGNRRNAEASSYYPHKVVSSTNGSATIIDGFPGGMMNVPRHGNSNGDAKRPSLRRLLSTQSAVTQMSDIAEDRELDNL